MKKFVAFGAAAVLAGFAACGDDMRSLLDYDSDSTVAVDATIAEGYLESASTSEWRLKREIRNQLMFTVGQMNGINGGVEMGHLTIDLGKPEPLASDRQRFGVSYKAKLFVAWPREKPIPQQIAFFLPKSGDYQGLQDFYQRFATKETIGTGCLSYSAHDVNADIFWYYYRPQNFDCAVSRETAANTVQTLTAHVERSPENTEGKRPEYHEVWKDGTLYATAIFGKNEADAEGDTDTGVQAYKELYRNLIARYGVPVTSTLERGQEPGSNLPEVQMVFATPRGDLDVHLFLVDSIQMVGSEFLDKYNTRTGISDFISYSGHSGLGANIRALARMGEFRPNQYQVFLINGCDTFAYVDQALADAKKKLNPEAAATKYLDIITNAMPSYFHSNARANMAIIDGLVNADKTYRQILKAMDRSQRAIVMGEEDNLDLGYDD